MNKVLLLVLAGISIGILIHGIRMRLKGTGSRHWSRARGVIKESFVDTSVNTGLNDPNSVSYFAAVTYSYRVGGREFTGKQVTFGDHGTPRLAHANAILARYPEGREIDVHFDPDRPSFSVLEKSPGANWMVIMAGAWFTAVSIFFLLRK